MSTFPQLLRRSSFITYDPLISRVYTSTPSSISKYSDFGLKHPLPLNPRRGGPRHIRINSLDAGPVMKTDYRSAEPEVRFISAWGRAGIPWRGNENGPSTYPTEPEDIMAPETKYFFSESEKRWVADLDKMTKEQFEVYLDRLRNDKKRFREWMLNRLEFEKKFYPNLKTQELEEDRTVVSLAMMGLSNDSDSNQFQSDLVSDTLSSSSSTSSSLSSSSLSTQTYNTSPQSTSSMTAGEDTITLPSILPAPHDKYGLQYSYTPLLSSKILPNLAHPGRALHPRKIRNKREDPKYSMGIQRPWTISLGGITVSNETSQQRTIRSSRTQDPILETDYTRSDTNRGIYDFNVTSASIKAPPMVVGLEDPRKGKYGSPKASEAWSKEWGLNSFDGITARSLRPLDTVRFDIKVERADEEGKLKTRGELGSMEWVGWEEEVPESRDWLAGRRINWKDSEENRRQALLERKKRGVEEKARLENVLKRVNLQGLRDA
ncbi:hypothetical protein M231_00990 [Tremella mesenterica]|uniref:Uncharacterized protein n=1 Tax=Tremella mesenterica TaxID=5217 RepID=A0A4Q1BUJ9_TREME|nr:uncharacterized protein TREMEDRAFT_73632 [Tremella mesenterica DSM 1558]EIW69838.1 hypothetical protein TREMEDRAFT_73632 [Tremella mesenterica DSM 1558]RXK41755.1 hypothetical protein M231_00990 [Tremella mesenterica]